MCLAPDLEHDLLQNVFGLCRRAARAHDHALQARGEMVEQLAKGDLVAMIADPQHPLRLVGNLTVFGHFALLFALLLTQRIAMPARAVRRSVFARRDGQNIQRRPAGCGLRPVGQENMLVQAQHISFTLWVEWWIKIIFSGDFFRIFVGAGDPKGRRLRSQRKEGDQGHVT